MRPGAEQFYIVVECDLPYFRFVVCLPCGYSRTPSISRENLVTDPNVFNGSFPGARRYRGSGYEAVDRVIVLVNDLLTDIPS